MFCDLGLAWWLISWLRACLCLVYGYLGWGLYACEWLWWCFVLMVAYDVATDFGVGSFD